MKQLLQSLVIAVVLAFVLTAGAQARHPRPILDELASPLSESELGGVGCLVGTTAVGGALVYLLGGWGAIAGHLGGPLPAARVLEGAAAGAFIFSSACYVGAALAPVAAMAHDSMTAPLVEEIPSTPDQAISRSPLAGSAP